MIGKHLLTIFINKTNIFLVRHICCGKSCDLRESITYFIFTMPGVTFNPLPANIMSTCGLIQTLPQINILLPVLSEVIHPLRFHHFIHCVMPFFRYWLSECKITLQGYFKRSSPIRPPSSPCGYWWCYENHLRTRVPHHDTGERYRNRPGHPDFLRQEPSLKIFTVLSWGLNSTTGVVGLVRGEFCFYLFASFSCDRAGVFVVI